MKRVITTFMCLMMMFSSFSTLFVLTNVTSLRKELDRYIEDAPYAPNIKIGSLAYYSKLATEAFRGVNRLDNLVYYLAGEMNISQLVPSTIDIPPLTEAEVSGICQLGGIESAFSFDQSEDIFRWTVGAPYGTGMVVYPLLPQYLTALHPPLREGRYFEESDPPNVLLIQEDYAQRIVTGPNILGRDVTVYTNAGTEQFKIIGVLARISSAYQGTTDVPFPIVIPYQPTGASSYVRGNGVGTTRPPQPQLWIVPEEGHEQQLLAGIRGIVGDGKYGEVVTSSTWDFEKSFGVQVRRERIRALTASSILTLLTSVLTLGSLIWFEISSRERELGVKRAVGATVIQITREYAASLMKLLCIGFAVAVLVLAPCLPLFTRYNALGYYVNEYKSPTDVLPLQLSGTSVLGTAVLLILIVVLVAVVVCQKRLRSTPSFLLLPPDKHEEGRGLLLALAPVIAMSVAAAFTTVSLMATTQNVADSLVRDIPQQSVLISSASSVVPFQDVRAIYTMDDYDAVRQVLRGKALVGCRKSTPAILSMPLPSGGTIDVRVAGATEDFAAIYEMTVGNGRFLTDTDTGKCVAGATIASSMNLQVGGTFMGDEIVGVLKMHSSLIDRTVYVSVSESLASPSPGGTSVLLIVKPLLDTTKEKTTATVLDLLESRHPGHTRGGTIDVTENVDAVIRSREGVYGLLSIFTLFSFLSALLYLAAIFLIEGIQKTREIGIKRAIGAEQQMVQKEFLWKGLRIGLTALGIGVGGGVLASFVLAKSEGMTFSLQPGLLIGFVVSCCACLLLASYIPARYASRIAPVDALREE
ncbi:MAG: ABC transporter permease [Candidatus Cryosericum sp.]